MTKRKIAILGGGISALTTALELTATPELRAKHDVSIWQMGWRLGGKCATGRDEQGRILEHGLHFWFGCYDNAWAMLRDVYAEWEDRPSNCPYRTGFDAFEPQNYTPLWTEISPDDWGFYNVTWPTNDDERGNGHVNLSFRGMLSQLANLLRELLGRTEHDTSDHEAVLHTVSKALDNGDPGRDLHDRMAQLEAQFAPGDANAVPLSGLFRDVLALGFAFLRGAMWDIVVRGKSLDELNAVEFRDWLISHGADVEMVTHSSVVRAIYDCCFWYVNGNHSAPSCGTGTALRVILRICTTYKESVMFTIKAGMGEAVVAPMYDVLRARGVTFNFFHKTTHLHLSEDKGRIDKVTLARQAELIGDYTATKVIRGIPTWPAEPYWDQLVDGRALQQAGVDFENHWSPGYPTAPVELVRGTDFDEIVLGISIGALKRLNHEEPSLAQELLDRGGRFARMVEGTGIVPTLAAQVWLPQDTQELGWRERPATVGGPEPWDIWADMSQTLPAEGLHSGSVHYLCGAYNTTLYRAPANADAQAEAMAEVTASFEDWVTAWGHEAWPNRPEGAIPPRALYLRANIDPSECTVGAAAGEVALRLKVDETGIENLTLTGCYTKTGLNTTCVEGAVMSGKQASRAICGSPRHVPGEHYL
ncbi:FAD-dependent oxidoreductase [Pontivivens insulae]|uniref:Amine oxidase domain-containing protein n=1 Tax=Pontivivens insulae TaxID=1639689 RepID=A0A2R8AF97_9RHOB|nr:FAD-dependent oxidoreductase [Pontivivens insulae]RED12146.1 uncharacterized protein with NAD-binding domain and iron-sulfur cluster [Pontivivens insulae]SPF30902.1 hypothetical protein POI8812_03247 [Pontivivens insulae]